MIICYLILVLVEVAQQLIQRIDRLIFNILSIVGVRGWVALFKTDFDYLRPY